jgi:hypothetical protein
VSFGRPGARAHWQPGSGKALRAPLPPPFPAIPLSEGFRVQSLADECSWVKIHRVLWRGFNHRGEPPEDMLDERRQMENVPGYRRYL